MNLQGQDYQQLLTEVIKKQIVILGPDITLAKARNVPGLEVADDGSVLSVTGNPQEITQKLIDQFVQLSGLIVKKTMEPLLSMNQSPTIQTVSTPPVTQAATPEPPTYPLTSNIQTLSNPVTQPVVDMPKTV